VSKEEISWSRLQPDEDQWHAFVRDWIAEHGIKGMDRLLEVFADLLDGKVERVDGMALNRFLLLGMYGVLHGVWEADDVRRLDPSENEEN
jgi:hypothetical protein